MSRLALSLPPSSRRRDVKTCQKTQRSLREPLSEAGRRGLSCVNLGSESCLFYPMLLPTPLAHQTDEPGCVLTFGFSSLVPP